MASSFLAGSWIAPRAHAADDDLVSARKLFLTGKYAEAVEAYGPLIAKHPVDGAIGLARVLAATGRRDEAAAALRKSTKEHPEAAQLPAELARLQFERGQYAEAAASVAAALKLDSDQLLARWIEAELHRVHGRLDEADKAYKWLVDYYNSHELKDAESLHLIGLAAAQFARWHRLSDQFRFLVNELYPDVLAEDGAYWPAHCEAGRLFLEKYNQADAAKELKAALALNANSAETHAALAALALQNYDLDEARRAVDRALEINPELIAALRYRADALMANFNTAEAIDVLETARKLNPASEETLGRLAAAYAVADGLPDDLNGTRMGAVTDAAVGLNPRCGEFFLALANGLDACRKFPSAARYYRQAIDRMPQLVEAHNALGLMHMRLGEEAQAKKLLDEAFANDPFNVRVNNTLKVLEVLDGYAVLETPHFIIKYDRIKDGILARYAAKYLEEEVYPELTKSFGFEPRGKSLFEIFSRARNTDGHGWFSARMVGLPYVGTVGACAGKMVAMASPNDMPKKFNWARVLKHEFVHVLNLQQTEFNIPHWFTEALAVRSEGFSRPQIWNELLAERVPKGELFNLDTINLGFARPKSGLDWQMAYCQSDLYAQYMTSTYGPDALAKMIAAYRDNLDTKAALARCFHVEQFEFEKGYLVFLHKIVAGLSAQPKEPTQSLSELTRAHEERPDDLDVSARLAEALFLRKEYPRARELADGVIAARPQHQLASYVLARIHLVVGDKGEALARLTQGLDPKRPDPKLLGLMASIRLKDEKFDEAARLYEMGAKLEPGNSQWLKSLARVYLQGGDDQKLAEVLPKLAALDADDPAIRRKLAQLSLAAKDYAAAERWAREALQTDVLDAATHRMAAEAFLGQNKAVPAADEYEVAVELSPDDAELRYALAKASKAAGKPDGARQALAELLERWPDHQAAKELLESLAP